MAQKHSSTAREKPRPPLLLIASAAALLVLIAGVWLLAGQPGATPAAGVAGPRVAVEPEKIDFGPVKVEQKVTARFVVKNEGSETLQILGQPQVRLVDGC